MVACWLILVVVVNLPTRLILYCQPSVVSSQYRYSFNDKQHHLNDKTSDLACISLRDRRDEYSRSPRRSSTVEIGALSSLPHSPGFRHIWKSTIHLHSTGAEIRPLYICIYIKTAKFSDLGDVCGAYFEPLIVFGILTGGIPEGDGNGHQDSLLHIGDCFLGLHWSHNGGNESFLIGWCEEGIRHDGRIT